MTTIVLVIHLLLAIAMIGVILIQKSEGGGLGMSGGGGMSGFMTGRSTHNLLTRTTAILAGAFFLTSIALAIMAGHQRAPRSIIEQTPPPAPSAPAQTATPSRPVTQKARNCELPSRD